MSPLSDLPKPSTWAEWKVWIGKRRWLYPLAGVEWALEWFMAAQSGVVSCSSLPAGPPSSWRFVFWFREADDRTKERHYRAWDLINSARGSTADGGRKDALQDLNKDGVSLAAAPLEQAYLDGVDLTGAFLADTNLQGAALVTANLQGAILWYANLQHAGLTNRTTTE